jgi:hypothetical protein
MTVMIRQQICYTRKGKQTEKKKNTIRSRNFVIYCNKGVDARTEKKKKLNCLIV